MTDPTTTLALQLGKQDIEKIIHSAIEAQVVSALKANGDAIIGEYARRMLSTKVDDQGKETSYSYGKPFLQWLSERTVREACEVAVKEWLAENKPHIVKAVKAALTKDRNKLAEQAAQTLISSGAYGLRVSIAIDKVER